MPSVEYDLRYLQAGVDVLEDYLLSAEMFWPTSGKPPPGEPAFPRLTLGGLLLARARLQAHQLNPAQESEFSKTSRRLEQVQDRWRTAWGQKTEREFRSRLNMWRDFLEDYRENPSGNYDRYTYEVRLRVMLHLLHSEADSLPSVDVELLSGLDQVLRSLLIPNGFVWDSDLEAGFPRSTYWYLYGRLPQSVSG